MKSSALSKSRRQTVVTLIMMLFLASTACGSSGGDDQNSSPATETSGSENSDETSGDAGQSGELTVGYVATSEGPKPFPQGAATLPHRVAIYDPFVMIDNKGEVVPMLAESWDFSEDGLSLVLHLRTGVTFHDGTPFDAEVAAANIELFKDPATNVQGGGVWAAVTGSVIDESTIEMTFDHPLPEIFSVMDTALITKPGELESGIGTGPFVFNDFKPREGMSLSANPDYWDPDRPRVSTLELREFADSAAAALAMESGDIDVLIGPNPSSVAQLESAGVVVTSTPVGAGYDVLVNASLVPDPLVRQALSLAFDRERFVETNLLGLGRAWSSVYAPSSPLHVGDDNVPVTPFDLDAARALLDEAGVDSLDITVMSPTTLPLDAFMPIYQADLATIGVNLTIEPADPAAWGQAVGQPGAIPELATHAYGFNDLDPALLFSAHPFRIGSNASGFNEPEYEELYISASSLVETDARYDAFREVDRYIAEQAFMFPVANPASLWASKPELSGLRTWRRSGYDVSTITIAE